MWPSVCCGLADPMASSGLTTMDVGVFLREDAQETAQAPVKVDGDEFESVLLDAMRAASASGVGGAQWSMVRVDLGGRNGFQATAAAEDVGDVDVVESVLCSVVRKQFKVGDDVLSGALEKAVRKRVDATALPVLIFANVDACGDAAVVQLVLQVLGELSVAATCARRLVVTSAAPIVLPSGVSMAWTHRLTAPHSPPSVVAVSRPQPVSSSMTAARSSSTATSASSSAQVSARGSRKTFRVRERGSMASLEKYLLQHAHSDLALTESASSLASSMDSVTVPASAPRSPADIDPAGLLQRADALAARLVGDVEDDGGTRVRVFGAHHAVWYRKELPVSSGESLGPEFVNLLMPKYYGPSADTFHRTVSTLSVDASSRETLVVSQASGSGKTKLAYVMAQRSPDPIPTVLVRVTCDQEFADPWAALVRVIDSIHARPDWTAEDKDEQCRKQVGVLLGCYALWARVVAVAIARVARERRTALSKQDMAVALLLAVRNGNGDAAVRDLYLVAAHDGRTIEDDDVWVRAHFSALRNELEARQLCLFVDEAQFCKGVRQGRFLSRGDPGNPADLFHAVATSANGLAGNARIVFCGTDPRMHVHVGSVSGAQGGPEPFSVTTHITADMMAESLAEYLHVDADSVLRNRELRALLDELEGRASNFFGTGWKCIVRAFRELGAPPLDVTARGRETLRVLATALAAAVVSRQRSMQNVVNTFFERAERTAVDAVLDAVLWRGGILPLTSGRWPDQIVESGLAIVPRNAVAIDLSAEPLLHAELTSRLTDPTELREATRFHLLLSVRRSWLPAL